MDTETNIIFLISFIIEKIKDFVLKKNSQCLLISSYFLVSNQSSYVNGPGSNSFASTTIKDCCIA